MKRSLQTLCTFVLFLFINIAAHAQTSWTGATSVKWDAASNWTAGVPTATVDAIVGNGSFTGAFQPTIGISAVCKSLTIGGTASATLTVNKTLSVAGNITINANGTLVNGAASISLTGAWNNTGTYNTTSTSSQIIFNGITQSINGNTTTFRKLTINKGSVLKLNTNVTITGSGSRMTVTGTLNPNESPTYQVTGTALTLSNNSVLKVNAATFTGNYNFSGTVTIGATSIIEYSSTTVSQVVTNAYAYSTLRISGSGTKTLSGNLPAMKSTASTYGNIYVDAGVFDLSTFTASRGAVVAGGTISVAANATIRIGGTNSFPANFKNHALALTSLVEYNGVNQAVSAETYGNVSMSSSAGAVVKTLPATALLVTGNLSTFIGPGTAVSFTAASNITVNGNVTLGAGTTFSAGSFTHTILGNSINNGTLTGNTSSITFNGPAAVISGTGVYNFNNLNIGASNITATSNVNVAGNFSTSSSGTFTHAATASITFTGAGRTLSGTGISFANVVVTGSYTTASNFIVTENLSVPTGGSLAATAGIITMSGSSKTITGAGAITFASLTITGSVNTTSNFTLSNSLLVNGTFTGTAGTGTFTGSSTLNGTADLYNVTLNGSSLQLLTSSVLGVANVLTISAGVLNVTSTIPNTVRFNGSVGQLVPGITYNNLLLSGGNTKTAAAAVTITGNLDINSSTTFNGVSYAHSISGNWINAGTFSAGTSTIQFTGSSDASITGATTFNILTINKSVSSNTITLLNSISVPTINMTRGTVKTGTQTLLITTTRTGPGIILGNIRRTHTFTAGVAYAFESPDNTILLSSANTVSSINVSVTPGTLSNFPYGASINREYDISVTGSLSSATATLRLHYEDAELNGIDEALMAQWRFNGTTWTSAGKTTSNATSNYVELTGLASFANRWTISDNPNVLSWNGSVSTDWLNASNWTVVQGLPGSVPGANDVVQLGTQSISYQPTIQTNVSVKSIVFGSVQPVTLTLNTGGALTSFGNLGGEWTSNAAHTINVANQALTIKGDMSLSDGTSGHIINVNTSGGNITINGSLNQKGGANITCAAAAFISVGGDYNYTSGGFTAGASNFFYNGSTSQLIGGVQYYHLTINKTAGIASINSPAAIGANFSITTGIVDINAATTVTGNVSIGSGGTINGTNAPITVAGNWTNSGVFNPSIGTVNFNGTIDQSISATGFNNLTINKASGAVVLAGNIALSGDLALLSGTFNLNAFSSNRIALGGAFSMSDGTFLRLSGANNYPGNYNAYISGPTSTAIYEGTSAQNVAGVNYGNIIFSNGGANAKTFTGAAAVNGDLIINSNATLNGDVYPVNLYGNWNNGGTFVPATGTVILNGSGKTISGNTSFNRVTVYGSYTVVNSDIIYNGKLTVTATGTFDAGAGLATVNGDLINSGVLISAGTTTFTGTSLQTISLISAITSTSTGVINFNGNISPLLVSTSTPTFANLNINNTAGVNPSVDWLILKSLTVNSGASFNGGAFTHTVSGNLNNNGSITSDGIINFNATAPANLQLGNGQFTSTGTVIFGGAGQTTISGNPTSMEDVIVANTNVAGITPSSAWNITGKFSINSNAIFNAGSYSHIVGGDIESDGVLNGNTSTFTMTSASGLLTGSPTTSFNHFVVSGNLATNSDFKVEGNFTNNGTFDCSVGALIMEGSAAAFINGTTTPSTIAELTINKSNDAMVTTAVDISMVNTMNIMNGIFNTSVYTISQDGIGGVLIINAGATLKIGGTKTIPAFSGYGIDPESTVDYAGTAQAISNSAIYGHLKISAPGNKTAANFLPLTIAGNFIITDGNFIAGNNTHKLAGNWIMTGGTFNNTSSTIQLNGFDDQDIQSIAAFNNLQLNKPIGLTTISSNININTALIFTLGKIAIANFNLVMNAGATFTTPGTNKYIIATGSGSVVQNVSNGTSKAFPVGTDNYYIPATIALTAASVSDDISVRVLPLVNRRGESGTAITDNAVNATWLISEAVAGGSDATVTLQWPIALELPGFIRSASRLAHYSNYDWEYGAADIAATGANPYAVTRSGFTSFSPFAVSALAALPVTWISVKGENRGALNLVSWSTAADKDNSFFVVEVAVDGRQYHEIGRVDAVAGPNATHNYQLQDSNIGDNAVHYYRIRQVDKNGRYTYSKTITLVNKLPFGNLQITPNPVENMASLSIQSNQVTIVNLVILDAGGKQVVAEKHLLKAGLNDIAVDLSRQPAGIYFVELTNVAGIKQTARILKK